MQIYSKYKKGFTLIELLVAVSLFMVVLTVATSVLMTVIYANKKTQAIQITMNSLAFALDFMIRDIRMGANYHCGKEGFLQLPQDCTDSPADSISFRGFGEPKGSYTQYYLKHISNSSGDYKAIWRKKVSPSGAVVEDLQITPPEVNIEKFKVYVRGSNETDTSQPFANITIKGSIGKKETTKTSIFGNERRIKTEFLVQTTASQRLLDI